MLERMSETVDLAPEAERAPSAPTMKYETSLLADSLRVLYADRSGTPFWSRPASARDEVCMRRWPKTAVGLAGVSWCSGWESVKGEG